MIQSRNHTDSIRNECFGYRSLLCIAEMTRRVSFAAIAAAVLRRRSWRADIRRLVPRRRAGNVAAAEEFAGIGGDRV